MSALSHQKSALGNAIPQDERLPDTLLTRIQIKVLEQQYEGLMALAASKIFHFLQRQLIHESNSLRLLLVVGPGNNGGDVLMSIPKMLAENWKVTVWLAHDPLQSSVDSLSVWRIVKDINHPQLTLWQDQELANVIELQGDDTWNVIVDGIYGIGFHPQRPHLIDDTKLEVFKKHLDAIGAINRYRATHPKTLVLAVDIPSGLGSDNGWVLDDGPFNNHVINADVTLAFLANKAGYHMNHGPSVCGTLIFSSLGVNQPLIRDDINPPLMMNTPNLWKCAIPTRGSHFHKGLAGEVVVIGGSAPMWGAGFLAGESALSLGAGRVYIAPQDNMTAPPPWIAMRPEIMCGLPRDGLLGKVTLIGPGLGMDEEALERVLSLCHLCYAKGANPSLVWDADALNLIAQSPILMSKILQQRWEGEPCEVMTPHPLEAARLLKLESASAVQKDRLSAVRDLALRFQRVVVLKGGGTLIASPDTNHPGFVRIWLNEGNVPALATAGTGDVLAGCIAALMAQGVSAINACLIAVWHHQQAGKHLQIQQGLLMARELIPEIRKIYHQWTVF